MFAVHSGRGRTEPAPSKPQPAEATSQMRERGRGVYPFRVANAWSCGPRWLASESRASLGDDRVYRYEVAYGDRTFRVRLGVAPDEKLSAFEIWPK
jgi:hypothetical protein